jgi:hypothetical protein
VSVLASLNVPAEGWTGNEEECREQISAIVTALLGLIGHDAVPVQDKEHVLLSNIFEYAWSRGQPLTLEALVKQVQSPPFDKLGVFAVSEYLSARARGKLATELNNILAAPSFQTWLTGAPLDMQKMLYGKDGRPRVAIFYIAHLSEAERQFVMTLLLESTIAWMRRQSGTTSLRALLYIDELYGYFPPYPFNPPTKAPLLRLLKQARAFGLGLMLATQNPGDLDYKGLTNAGTWIIGRLSTDNDKQRLLTGFQTMGNAGSDEDLKALSRIISDLQPRTFLMSNVHDPNTPMVMRSRWAMSYLRGPLTKQQISVLMADQKARLFANQGTQSVQSIGPTYSDHTAAVRPQALRSYAALADQHAARRAPPPPDMPSPPPTLPEMPPLPEADVPFPTVNVSAQAAPPLPPQPAAITPVVPSQPARRVGLSAERPVISSDINQLFLPQTLAPAQALSAWQQRTGFSAAALSNVGLAYRPALLAQAAIRFQDRKSGTFTVRLYTYQLPEIPRTGVIHWQDHLTPPIDTRTVGADPLLPALFNEIPDEMTDPKRMNALRREIVDMLYATARLGIPHSPALNLFGSADGDIGSFQALVQQRAREGRDAEIDAVTRKYEDLLDRLTDQQRKYQTRLQSSQAELGANKRLKTFTTGEAILGLMQGRTAFTLSRMSQAEYWKQRSEGNVNMSAMQVQQMNEEIDELQRKFQIDMEQINEKWARAAVEIDTYEIQPYKKDIMMELFGIGWHPYYYGEAGGQPVMIPAY